MAKQPSLSLGLPDLFNDRALVRQPAMNQAIAHFERAASEADSPIRAVRKQEARAADTVPIPPAVAPELRAALEQRGIAALYRHQAEAFDHVTAGRNAVVVTPTASGKTLCYNLPILNRLLAEPDARALYLFPTKALAEDQMHELQAAIAGTSASISAHTYDGDTPQDARRAIRERANLILTNPDMLHTGILPQHTKWAKVFETLRYFVIDELHSYRGVFGSHLANLIRRLKRICTFYGSSPQFICCSATIGNPLELAEAVTGEPFSLVDRNGAPSGERYFVFYNPPVVNAALGLRRSYLQESKRIALDFIDQGQQTMVFTNSRLAAEILVTYLKDACARRPMSASAIRGYRAGYLPRERREIERELRQGDIRAVVSTSALELGIDIGSLDAVVLAGYPGTIASSWQRAGRAGRRQSTSLAVLVASSNPLDQYIVEHPDYFFTQSPEQAHINADNIEIALNHLKCAAFELPLREDERFGPHPVQPMCEFLQEQKLVHPSGGLWHWVSDTYPADAVSLRAVTSDNFVIVDITREPDVIGEMPFPTALTDLHEKAIYLHEARQYQVERFDYEGRKAYVRRVECDYYTQAIEQTQVKILTEFDQEPLQLGSAQHGQVRVNHQVVGWKKIRFFTHENVGSGHLSLPEQEMHTTSFWLHFPPAFFAAFANVSGADRQGALIGLGAAMRTVASLLLMTDPREFGMALTEEVTAPLRELEPNLHLYDNYPGGIGQSGPLFKLTRPLLEQTAVLIEGCACEAGCPSCVGPPLEVGQRGKSLAVQFARGLLSTAIAA